MLKQELRKRQKKPPERKLRGKERKLKLELLQRRPRLKRMLRKKPDLWKLPDSRRKLL